MAFSKEKGHGNLLIFRLFSPTSDDEVLEYLMHVSTELMRLNGQGVVLTDVSGLEPEFYRAGQSYIEVLRRTNNKLRRSAIYVGEHAILAMRIYNMITEANNPCRRAFRSTEPLRAWLGEVLTYEEQFALGAYLQKIEHSRPS